MTIEEIQKRRRQLEDEIHNATRQALLSFINDTGLSPTDIYLDTVTLKKAGENSSNLVVTLVRCPITI